MHCGLLAAGYPAAAAAAAVYPAGYLKPAGRGLLFIVYIRFNGIDIQICITSGSLFIEISTLLEYSEHKNIFSGTKM